MKVLKWLALGAAALLSACGTRGELDPATAAPSDSESVIVVGISPDYFRASFFPGSIEGGKFSGSTIRSVALYGSTVDGYLIGKVKAGETIGITQLWYQGSTVFSYATFSSCEKKTMVLQIPKGKVLYAGSLDIRQVGQGINWDYEQDLERARRYVDEKYPSLKGRLELLEPQWLTSSRSCTPTAITIPIPSGR